MMEAGRRKLLLQIAACAVLACALTIALTYPVAFNAANHVPSDLGDPLLCCWLLWWNYEHILTLNFDGYWDAPIFHPFPKGLALAEHMFGPSLISAPLYPLTHDLVLIYNLLFLGTYFFALTGMVALARHLKLSWPAAWLAGIIFTFCSHHYSQIPHLQVLYGGLAPWSMFFLLRLTKKPGLWDALGLFASFWLICFSCLYHAAFFSVILGISGVFLFFSRRLWNKPKSLALILLAPVLVGISMVPVQRAYQSARELFGIQRTLNDVLHYSADVTSYLAASFHNRLIYDLTKEYLRPEGDIYAGVIALLLAALLPILCWISAWRQTEKIRLSASRRVLSAFGWIVLLIGSAGFLYVFSGHTWDVGLGPLGIQLNNLRHPLIYALSAFGLLAAVNQNFRRYLAAFVRLLGGDAMLLFMILAVAAFLFSLGPEIKFNGIKVSNGPYLWLYKYVPGFSQMRVPARFANYVMLSLGLLAAGGLDAVISRIKMRRLGLVVAILFIGLSITENFSLPLKVARVPQIPEFYDWLKTQEVEGAVLEMPLNAELRFPDVIYQYYQTKHGKPLINGYSGFWPRKSDEFLWHLAHETEIIPWLRNSLQEFHPDYIILHTDSSEWERNGQSPAMFIESDLFRVVYQDGPIVVLGWSDAGP